MEKKLTITILITSLLVVIFLHSTSAYLLYCLSDGQQLPPDCENDDCKYTCDLKSGSGYCQVCTTDSGTPGVNPSSCFDESCKFLDGSNSSGGLDLTPPNLTVTMPLDKSTFNSNRVNFEIRVDSRSRLDYKNNDDSSWHKLCSGCSFYGRHIRLEEGKNNVTVRAKKLSNNLIEIKNLVIYVDSKAPDFRDSLPEDGQYANGEFTVEYTEENLENITLYYKGSNESTWKTLKSQDCPSGKTQHCTFNVNLDSYESSTIDYYFMVCDATLCDQGPIITTAEVDTMPPEITLLSSFESVYSNRRILFYLSINEEVDLYYVDNNDGKEPHRQRRICSNCDLINKLISFSDGLWNITIYAYDDAGNKDFLNVNFIVDTRSPSIRSTLPKKGFIGSPFYVEFQEENPIFLSIHYGNDLNDNRIQEVDINSCIFERNKYKCTTEVNLEDFDGQEIEYFFNLTDIANANDVSKTISLIVDETPPLLNSINHTTSGRRVELILNITELNFDEATYIDNSDTRPREKRFCSRLSNGICKRKITLREGLHELDISVFDKAGNAIAQNYEVFI
jgi:hypothetical protein